MRATVINRLLTRYAGKAWTDAPVNLQMAFYRRIRGRFYGADALIDAYSWFYEGWVAANLAALISSVSQINSPQNLVPSHVPGLDL
jgi:hypothetical protein